jgi:hypothetical protein
MPSFNQPLEQGEREARSLCRLAGNHWPELMMISYKNGL